MTYASNLILLKDYAQCESVIERYCADFRPVIQKAQTLEELCNNQCRKYFRANVKRLRILCLLSKNDTQTDALIQRELREAIQLYEEVGYRKGVAICLFISCWMRNEDPLRFKDLKHGMSSERIVSPFTSLEERDDCMEDALRVLQGAEADGLAATAIFADTHFRYGELACRKLLLTL